MDPYRTAPERPPEPELDRLPVYLRGGLIRGGELVVTPTQLVFVPRYGRPRGTPIERGLDGLGLAEMFAPDELVRPARATTSESVTTWVHVTASAPYREALAVSASENVLDRAYLWAAGGPDEDVTFAVILDGDRALLIEAERFFHACFELPADLVLPDRSSRTLARALRWLPRSSFARIAQRAGAQTFSLDEARLAPPLRVEGRRYLLLGTVVIELVRPQIAAIERWLATPPAPP